MTIYRKILLKCIQLNNGALTIVKDKNSTDNVQVIPIKSLNCPMCGSSSNHKFRPFCTRRCANLDLGNWFGEAYRVPTDESEDLERDTSE